jgi:hypothetical protein
MNETNYHPSLTTKYHEIPDAIVCLVIGRSKENKSKGQKKKEKKRKKKKGKVCDFTSKGDR